MLRVRGDAYRQGLAHLTDAEWQFAIEVALRTNDWFPTLHELLDYAADAPRPERHALPEDTRTVEERRADAKRGVAFLRAELERRGLNVGESLPIREMPAEIDLRKPDALVGLVRLTDARREELREQSRKIAADENTPA